MNVYRNYGCSCIVFLKRSNPDQPASHLVNHGIAMSRPNKPLTYVRVSQAKRRI